MYKTAMHKRYGCDKIATGSSGFSSISKNTQLGAYDMFAKVNSKYGRVQEPVKMENMLSREEQKTHLSLDPPAAKIQAQKALEQFGYLKHTTENYYNATDVRAKLSPNRVDKCIIGF
jgi:hypothetical protein